MCTAASLKTKDFYMGRNLDYEFSYGESITVTPRNYRFGFEDGASDSKHYAIIGMAHVADGYPLYYDAVNECGLGIAGLNFVGNAHYGKPEDGRINVAQYEFVPWLLRNAADIAEARQLLEHAKYKTNKYKKYNSSQYDSHFSNYIKKVLTIIQINDIIYFDLLISLFALAMYNDSPNFIFHILNENLFINTNRIQNSQWTRALLLLHGPARPPALQL